MRRVQVVLDLGHDADLVNALTDPAQADAEFPGRQIDKFAHAVLLASGDHKILGLLLL
ncbi:hypothetical protein D3C81_2279900 [compost metagenome]